MMATQIPNLWPTDLIKVDVRTPLDILLMQTGQLQQASKGLLESQARTVETADQVSHEFDIVAPSLGNYRHTILTIRHAPEMPYPVTVDSIADEEELDEDVVALLAGRVIYTEEDFIKRLRMILSSKRVAAVIQSLLARTRAAKMPILDETSSGVG
jgi:hypothetical protein